MLSNPDNKSPENKTTSQIMDSVFKSAKVLAAKACEFFASVPDRFRNLYDNYKNKSSNKIRRTGRERIYRLKGYTTVAKINRKRHAERQQRFLRKFLFVFIAILLVVLMFTIYNPFKDMSELKKILGIESVDDLTITTFVAETIDSETTESDFIISTESPEDSIED